MDRPFRLALPAAVLAVSLACALPWLATGRDLAPAGHGVHFKGQSDRTSPLPRFAQVKAALPEPVLDAHPDWLRMYWKCWELAFKHLKQPLPGSPLVANWLDEAFSPNLFQWDTCFMMMFARYGFAQFPAIQSLDNFYALQRPGGYICREYVEATGAEVKFGHHGGFEDPQGWANSVNPPLFAWAETESFKLTGDMGRFQAVLPVLEQYVAFLNRDGDPEADPATWLDQGRRSAGTPHQLYWNTPLGSGMDNTPKPTRKGAGWVDASCQMVMQYRELALMHRELGHQDRAAACEQEARAIGERINRWCWDEADGFYYDVLADGSKFRKKTLCGFWPLLAGIASPAQAARLVAHLRNEREFWRPMVFPALAADEPEYVKPTGDYWLGGVWAPTNYAVIKGLEAYGEEAFATEATERYLAGMAEVFRKTGTVWENYAPERLTEGKPAAKDFVGWTGIGPITLLIENVLGFRPDGVHNRLVWRLTGHGRQGIRRLRFGKVATDVISEGDGTVAVTASAPYTLVVNGVEHAVPAGPSVLRAW